MSERELLIKAIYKSDKTDGYSENHKVGYLNLSNKSIEELRKIKERVCNVVQHTITFECTLQQKAQIQQIIDEMLCED